MAKFAHNTSVPVARSQSELKGLLSRFGAKQVVTFEDYETGRYCVVFTCEDRRVRIEMPVPKDSDPQEERRMWRCLVMLVKAKAVAIEDGLITFDEAFFADLVVPVQGQPRLVQHAMPQLVDAYRSGKMPSLLPESI
jgi:hypothetical protein